MPRPDGAAGPPLPDPAAPGRALPAPSGSPWEGGGDPGCCRAPALPGASPAGTPRWVCSRACAPAVVARDRRGSGWRVVCCSTGCARGWALRCCFSLQALANGQWHWRQVAWSPSGDEHLKAAVGPACYLQGCAPGYESAAVKDEAEELGSLGLLVTIVVVVEGVLETQQGSLSTRSRSPKELVTCYESGHPAWMARS